MRTDTPPPDDEDTFSDGMPAGIEDIEIIEDYEIEEAIASEIPLNDEARVTFSGHSGSVFCCALEKNEQFAVSGGQDDKGFVWSPQTGEVVLECQGHKDSVFYADFSHDSKYVATADMSGVVQVWKLDSEVPVFNYDVMEELRFAEWNSLSPVLFAGAVDGNCWMWHIPSEKSKVFQGNSPCNVGKIMPSGSVSVVGHDDGTIQFFDLKSSASLHTITGPSAHSGQVTAIDCHKDNILVLTGATDGTAKVLKTTDGKVLFTLRCEPEDLENKSVESVEFFASHPLIATGTLSGNLAIWDIPTQVRRLQCEQEAGIIKLICDPSSPMVYTAGVDGIVRLMDGRTGQVENSWDGHPEAVLDFCLSRDGNTILTASDDGTCKIFDTRA